MILALVAGTQELLRRLSVKLRYLRIKLRGVARYTALSQLYLPFSMNGLHTD